MYRQFPSGPLCIEFPDSLVVVAAPFVKIGHFDTAATTAVDVMGKDKFPLGRALFKGLFEPPVLGIPMGNQPFVFCFVTATIDIVHRHRRRPKGIDDDEQSIALPGAG